MSSAMMPSKLPKKELRAVFVVGFKDILDEKAGRSLVEALCSFHETLMETATVHRLLSPSWSLNQSRGYLLSCLKAQP